MCDHRPCIRIYQLPLDSKIVLETCCDCNLIRRYNTEDGTNTTVPKQCEAKVICHGPQDTLLVRDNFSNILTLKWNKEKKEVDCVNSVETKSPYVHWLCYMKKHDTAILLSATENSVTAVKLSNGSPLWTVSKSVDGKAIKPNGVTLDTSGHAFIADGDNNRLLVIVSGKGILLQVLPVAHNVRDVHFIKTSKDSELCLRSANTISCYRILPHEFLLSPLSII